MPPDWLPALIAEIERAQGDDAALGAIFARLQAEHGAAEAGRRWWAAFGATDASPT